MREVPGTVPWHFCSASVVRGPPRLWLGGGELQHRDRRAGYLWHLAVPTLRHLVRHEIRRDALGQEAVGLGLRLGLGEDRLGPTGGFDRVALRLELILL